MLSHWLVVCRAFLWITFAYAFWGKVRSIPTFVTTIHRFALLPDSLARPATYFFLGFEASLILLLGTGIWLRMAFALAFALLLLFTLALIVVLWRRQETACNCFSTDDQPIGLSDIVRNGGLLLVALLGWLASPYVDMGWVQLTLLALIGIVYGLLWIHLSDIVRLFGTIYQTRRLGAS